MKTLRQRFNAKWKLDPSGCWLWTASVDKKGYGYIRGVRRGGGCLKAHRVSWSLHFGAIPKGMSVCHRCDVRHCVNPAHLFLGDNATNNRDSWAKHREWRMTRLKGWYSKRLEG